MQRKLWEDETKTKTIIEVSTPTLSISGRNYRQSRSDEYVQRLADRMTANGYEITRAMWAYKCEGGYEVFAGGTRLKAAQLAKIEIVPIVLHSGFTEDEIVKLAHQDNEDDEYHTPVSIVDIWGEYQNLSDDGWTQERIGKVMGIGRVSVSRRLTLHKLSDKIKEFVRQKLLKEAVLIEIIGVFVAEHFSDWLTAELAQLELATWAAQGHTTRETRERVKKWKGFIECAEKIYQEFEPEITMYDLSGTEPQLVKHYPRDKFVKLLAQNKSRSMTSVKAAKRNIDIFIANNLKEYKIWIDAKTAKAARAAIHAQKVEKLLSRLKHDSYSNVLKDMENDSVDLIFTDPPYDEDHISDYGELARIAARILKPKGSLIVYAGHYALPELFKIMCPHLDFWWPLVVKHSGSAARLPGKWVFVHYKPLLWFTKGGRRDNRYVSDFIHSKQPEKKQHDWEQHVSEAEYCIEQLTDKGDLVVDPFCGSGTTAIAALNTERDFITCDIDIKSIEMTEERLIKWLDK